MIASLGERYNMIDFELLLQYLFCLARINAGGKKFTAGAGGEFAPTSVRTARQMA